MLLDKEKMNIFISGDEMKEKIKDIAAQINKDYKGEQLIVVGILRGAIIFFADLVRELDIDVQFDFMTVSSYGDAVSTSGEVKIKKDLESSINGKNVLIVEDVIDTGLTLDSLKRLLLTRNPKSLKICCMLDKPSRRQIDIKPDYVCHTLKNDEFLIGYGLDFKQSMRQYDGIYSLSQEQIDQIL